MEIEQQNKLNIIKDLFIEEECSPENLKRLVDKSKPFLKIEGKSGKIIIEPSFQFTIKDRVIIYLIGRYFVKELGLDDGFSIDSRTISEDLDIAQTTISGPLGDYVKNNIVQVKNGSHSIKYYKIENELDILTGKYITKKETVNATRVKIRPKISVGRAKRNQSNNLKIKDELSEPLSAEDLEKELKKHDLTIDHFHSVFNIIDGRIILMRGWTGYSTTESNVKATLLFLTGNKLLYGLDEVASSELRKALIESGLTLKNHSTTLKGYSAYVVHKKGPIGSTKTSYRITLIGIQKGIKLIKDIVENTSNFDLEFKQKTSSPKNEKPENINIGEEELEKGIHHFVEQNSIDKDKLRTFFDFQKESVSICNQLKENTRKTAQLKTLMLLGILLKKVYDVSSFSGKDTLKKSRITYDRLDLLDRNKHYKIYFSRKPKSAMRLNYAGEKKALEMLKEYLEEGQCTL